MRTVRELAEYVNMTVTPVALDCAADPVSLRHMEAIGCIVTDRFFASSFLEALRVEYAVLFSSGFESSQFEAIVGTDSLTSTMLAECLREPSLMRLKAFDFPQLKRLCNSLGVTTETAEKLRGLLAQSLIDDTEVAAELQPLIQRLNGLTETWANLSRVSMTPVGIAIAVSNIRRRTGQETDLEQWLR